MHIPQQYARGRILSISSRGRISLDVDGLLVIGQLLHGGGWIGDRVEGDMRPGLRIWRNTGNGITSRVRVLMNELAPCAMPPEATEAEEPAPGWPASRIA